MSIFFKKEPKIGQFPKLRKKLRKFKKVFVLKTARILKKVLY